MEPLLADEEEGDREDDERDREDDGESMEGFFRPALFEFSEIAGARSEGKPRSFGLDDDGGGEEDARKDEGPEEDGVGHGGKIENG